MFLDTQLRLIGFEKLFQGTINKTVVHPREVLKRALALNAKAMILVHNHPSGDCCPSHADRQLTQSIKALMEQVDIDVVDHLVVGGDQVYSFAEYGEL